MNVERGERFLLIALPPILIAIGIALALNLDGARGIWAAHPFLTGLVTGFLTLATTVLVVNRFLELRADRRWRSVALVAYRGLAREARDVSTTLAALYCDLDHYIGPQPSGGTQGHTRDLDPLYEIRHPISAKASLRVLHLRNLPTQRSDPDDVVPAARMRVLLADRDWCQLAHDEVERLQDRQLDVVSKWATMMLSSSEPRQLLDAFATLQVELFALAVRLQKLVNEDKQNGHHEEADADIALDLWRSVDAKSRVITNRLWEHSEYGLYSLKLPPALAKVSLGDAFAHRGRVGAWRSMPTLDDDALFNPFYGAGLPAAKKSK